jgi:hypothetical protein
MGERLLEKLKKKAEDCTKKSVDDAKMCNGCGLISKDKTLFSMCGSCKKVYYCSRDCQVIGMPTIILL